MSKRSVLVLLAALSAGCGGAPEGMAWVPGGWYWRGCDDRRPDGGYMYLDANPVHRVHVDGFWIDRTEVTNAQFAKFVAETGYQTVAERQPKLEDFPEEVRAHIILEKLKQGSVVFIAPPQDVSLEQFETWQHYVPGACWKLPEGPGSSIEGRQDHPVVHVCWEDAAAYANWAGKRLPTEAEWECAARGGLDRKPFTWGDEFPGKGHCNIWQGRFPRANTRADGFERTAPVRSYPANGHGLYDMAGNVWEWCADWYRHDYYGKCPDHNPPGPDSSFDPLEPTTPKRVQKGGSFLCSDIYCGRYRPGTRGKGAPDSGASHVGFRCAK